METASFPIPPFSLVIDNVEVRILEVLKSTLVTGESWYHVVVTINYKGTWSKRYTIDVKSNQDLINKLKIEITKIKFIELSQGMQEVKRLIT